MAPARLFLRHPPMTSTLFFSTAPTSGAIRQITTARDQTLIDARRASRSAGESGSFVTAGTIRAAASLSTTARLILLVITCAVESLRRDRSRQDLLEPTTGILSSSIIRI